MNYFLHIFILVGIYSILGISLNLLAGYSGLLTICQAGFYGLGAYATALLTLKCGLPWFATLPLSFVMAGICAYAIGKITLRFRDDYFVIATFAFQIILYSLMLNWASLTQGPMGLPGIKQPVIFNWEIDEHWKFLVLVLIILTLCFWVVRRLVASPFGRSLKGIREDENCVLSAGKNPIVFKTSAFTIGAMLAGLSGSLYAGYITFIDPSSFTVQELIFILAIVIIGGAGSLWGPVIGAVVLVSLPEALRFIGMPSSIAANMRQILYGAALVACMMWRPQGLIGEFSFRKNENS